MKEDKIKELLEKLKDSIECPIITFPSYDGSDEERIDNDTYLTPEDCKVLLNYITKIETNWKELKNWLEEELRHLKNNSYEYSADYYVDRKIFLENVLSKMQELESSNNEES